MEINQILPSFTSGDAISNEVMEIKNFLKSEGHDCNVFANHIHSSLCGVKSYRKISKKKRDCLTIHHMSIGSELDSILPIIPGKKMMIYHNITPSDYFTGVNDELARLCSLGRQELSSLRACMSLALGDSEYNRKELVEAGYEHTGVLPILLNFSKYDEKPNLDVMKRYGDGKTNIIFVGRISPNKRQDEVIRCFHHYKKYVNPNSRLILVGSYVGMERYYFALKDLLKKLGLSADVVITGQVGFPDLVAHYLTADLFLCMSEHEGFCVPLLESMYYKIPIIAYNAAAVPSTLGGSGILVNKKDPLIVGELMDFVLSDENLKERMIKKQTRRLKDFSQERTEAKLRKYLNAVTR